MNRVNNEASRLLELYCEIELRSGEDEQPIITKTYPKSYPDVAVTKILPNFCFPYPNKLSNRVERRVAGR